MPSRHAARLPHGPLKTFGKALERFRKTDARRLPIRVGQHEMVEQMRKRLASDRDMQAR